MQIIADYFLFVWNSDSGLHSFATHVDVFTVHVGHQSFIPCWSGWIKLINQSLPFHRELECVHFLWLGCAGVWFQLCIYLSAVLMENLCWTKQEVVLRKIHRPLASVLEDEISLPFIIKFSNVQHLNVGDRNVESCVLTHGRLSPPLLIVQSASPLWEF